MASGCSTPQGETTERIEEAGRIAARINVAPPLFSQGSRRARRSRCWSTRTCTTLPGHRPTNAALLSYNLRGHYARLWRLGIAVDFVAAEEVAAGRASGYKVAILPMPLALDVAYFAPPARLRRGGGHADQRGLPRPL